MEMNGGMNIITQYWGKSGRHKKRLLVPLGALQIIHTIKFAVQINVFL